MTSWARLVACVALASASCGGHLRNFGNGLERVRDVVGKIDCRDGAPARILIDVHCQEGICGVTCAPDRWK
jgi:hypothetical protein